tara:strand:- start:12848 stop:13108 length:261 start_codon:yes stop_codon:yes gene_type:complete
MSRFHLFYAAAIGLSLAVTNAADARAGEYALSVDRVEINTGEFTRNGIGYNGNAVRPILRFKEGEDVTIKVTNNLDESTSMRPPEQ